MAATSQASTGISVEGVSDYTTQGSTNTDCTTEAQGFLNGLTGNGGFTTNIHWYDNNVFDSDFLDPDCSGCDTSDNDTSNFDNAGTAVALVCAHGSCNDATGTTCTTSSQCGTGYCPGTPPTSASSACINNSPRSLVTSSTGDIHGHFAVYGPGNARWGEDTTTGSWAGAGTNGDNNAVFLINSCAVRQPFLLSQLFPAFAGMALVNLIMPTSNLNNGNFADAVTWSSRGSTLATNAVANLNGSLKSSWDALLDSTPQTQGGSCPDRTGTYTYGGGHGITGCGAHVSVSVDSTLAFAQDDLNDMTWSDTQAEGWDSFGNSYWQWWAHCNYDCITYPFQK